MRDITTEIQRKMKRNNAERCIGEGEIAPDVKLH